MTKQIFKVKRNIEKPVRNERGSVKQTTRKEVIDELENFDPLDDFCEDPEGVIIDDD